MNEIKRTMQFLLAAVAMMPLLMPPAIAAEPPVTVEISIERLSASQWQASWKFSAPVDAFRLYPPQLGFRSRSWQLPGDGLELEETPGGAVISKHGSPFSQFSLRFRNDSQFEPATYVPVLPFSDGGAAIYTGHFSGDVRQGDEWVSIPSQFEFRGLAEDNTVVPAWASELSPVYAYVGPQRVKESQQVRMIADAQMPQWLLDTFSRSVPKVTALFSERLGFQLEHKPLVLIAAGKLRESDGYSVKGAGLERQFTVMLQGRALGIGSRDREQMFEKMLAHELFHVWQQAMPGGDFNPEQAWLHEGSAEALAVQGLYAAGIWSAEELERFHREQKETCLESIAGTELSRAADEGNWTAVYACGYLEFTEGVDDPFALWRRLAARAQDSGSPYTQQMLEMVRTNP